MSPVTGKFHYDTAGRTIGLVMHRFAGVACAADDKIFTGIAAECNALRVGLQVRFFNRSREFRAMITPLTLQVEGLIICGVQHPDITSDLAAIDREILPVVSCYNSPIHRDIPNIGADQVGLGRCAVEHLIAGGCKRIVLLPAGGLQARTVGYRQAHRQAGINICPELQIDFDCADEFLADGAAEEAVADLISRGIEFDGIFAQSDFLAFGAMRALEKAGIDIPSQVQIIGIDNQPLCFFGHKQLSSATIPTRYRTAFAVRAVVDRIKGRKVDSMSCEPKIFKRHTTTAELPPAISAIGLSGRGV